MHGSIALEARTCAIQQYKTNSNDPVTEIDTVLIFHFVMCSYLSTQQSMGGQRMGPYRDLSSNESEAKSEGIYDSL